MNRSQWIALCVALVAGGGSVHAQSPSSRNQQTQQLKRLSIEELADLPVTTPARRSERLSDVAAAVSVIRQEDLRRAGVTSLPGALRLADALHVAQAYGPGWAIGARGFNITTSNKLLVLIDGRTVYSPLFGGVFWDVQDVVLADIDRIEVIRGPGGTLWGANAVNGVINVITKRAVETQGGLVSLTVGNESRVIATARYGGVTPRLAYRAYMKFRADDQHVFATGAPGRDDTQFGQAGFRVESDRGGAATWLVQGDGYGGAEGLFDRGATRVSGGNVLARWSRQQSDRAHFQAQVYYDETNRRVQRQYRASRHTFDVDTQQQLQLAARHMLLFGAGARASRGDDLGDGPGFFFDPQVRTSTLLSAFVQDDVQLTPNRLSAVVGTKIERNDFTGVEVQPNLRFRFAVNGAQTVWAAVSRAVRMPTRFDTDLRIRNPLTNQLQITGRADFDSENVTAYEAGYRVRPTARVSIDLATYFNRWNDLRSLEYPTTANTPVVIGNTLNADTSGAEVAATVSMTSAWQAHGSYTYLWRRVSFDAGSHDPTRGVSEGNDPSHFASIRNSFDLRRHFEADFTARYVSNLPQPAVKAYTELSGRIGWRPSTRWDFSIGGQNLLHDRHEEFAATTPREFFERSVYLRSVWNF